MHISANSHPQHPRLNWLILMGHGFAEMQDVQSVDTQPGLFVDNNFAQRHGRPARGWIYQIVQPVRLNIKDEIVTRRIPCERIVIHEDLHLIMALQDYQRPVLTNEHNR